MYHTIFYKTLGRDEASLSFNYKNSCPNLVGALNENKKNKIKINLYLFSLQFLLFATAVIVDLTLFYSYQQRILF